MNKFIKLHEFCCTEYKTVANFNEYTVACKSIV